MSYDEEDNRIESKELLVIKKVDPEPATDEQKYSKSGYTIRVVQWLFAGKGKRKGTVQGSESLEKREFYLNEDGEIRTGKSKGFGLVDMVDIKNNWAAIVEALKNPPAPAWPEGKASTAKKPAPEPVPEDIEEVPF